MNIASLITEDPQRLIDEEIRFNLWAKAIGTITCTLADGLMAGSPWLLVRCHDGVLAGKDLWLEGWDPEEGLQYGADAKSDGYRFNAPEPLTDDNTRVQMGETVEYDLVPGGRYLEALDGTMFFLVKGT